MGTQLDIMLESLRALRPDYEIGVGVGDGPDAGFIMRSWGADYVWGCDKGPSAGLSLLGRDIGEYARCLESAARALQEAGAEVERDACSFAATPEAE